MKSLNVPAQFPLVYLDPQKIDLSESGLSPAQDLQAKVYEGGFQIWEACLDTLQYLHSEQINFKDKVVLDLGCGHGFLGILALQRQAKYVYFSDFNLPVLNNLTAKNIQANLKGLQKGRFELLGGDWMSLPIEQGTVDIILCSEVIYRPQNYKSIITIAQRKLRLEGLLITGNKQYYFGVGGNVFDFQKELQSSELKVVASRQFKSKNGGNKRTVLKIKK